MRVVRLDRTGWRVSTPDDDHRPSHLLGYIECLERHRYEVLWLDAPIGWAYVASFDEALAAVAQREQFAGVVHEDRDSALVLSTIPQLVPSTRGRHLAAAPSRVSSRR